MLGTKKGTKKVQSKKRYDSDLSPEELEQAIALFKAQRDAAPVMDGEEEVKMDADDIVNGVRERKDRRDSDEEQMDAEEIIAEQEGDIEALLEVIDELQAASDMSATDGDDPAENNDEGDDPDSNMDDDDLNGDGDDDNGQMNRDSVDKLVGKKLRDYLDVCRVADRLNLDGVENLSLINARKKVILAVNPKLRLDGKSDSYINAAYDIAKQSVAERKRVDDQRRRIMSKNLDSMDSTAKSSASAARERMIAKREKIKNGGED